MCEVFSLHEVARGTYDIYLLPYSMVQSPSWEANWFAASQEIPRISRNPKVHYRTHKRPPLVSILGQPNPVHIPTSHLLEIHPNIIHPSTPRSPQRSSSFRFPQQDTIHPLLLAHTRHMHSPSHSSRFYHPHNIGWGLQIRLLLQVAYKRHKWYCSDELWALSCPLQDSHAMAVNSSFTFFAVCFVKNLPLILLSNYFFELVNQLQTSLHTSEELGCLS